MIKGKKIILIDDSLVRGTTCFKIVKMLYDSGAKEVILVFDLMHLCVLQVGITSATLLSAGHQKQFGLSSGGEN